ncbi:MAG: cytidylate kinase-like family protein [Eubacterium sp.]|nr:cytidylate kinase-like family protein [Eubacterium sp.]
MAENKIITIGRQFGSNGRQIGELVAKKLGVTCYDKQLIKKAAKESGLWEDLLDEMDEKPTNSFLYSVVMDPYAFAYSFDNSGYGMNINQKAFMATYNTIQTIARNESCVIIGRCSNYVLRDFNNVYNFFLYAPLEERIKIVMERFNLDEKKAKDQIIKEDKARASYFNYYTSMKWGNIESYDCCLNTTLMDAESMADLIIEISKK